jgi:NAD+ synthase (glutamine-hydrolysing)
MKDFIKNLKFISHQINSEIGNIEGNTNKIINELEIYKNERNIIHIFPETAITGYLCGSLYDRLDFVKESQESFDKIVDYIKLNIVDAIVILGNIRFIGLSNAGFPILKNSAFIINTTRGKFYVDYYDKQLLANGDHHEDRKYFREGDETKIFNVSLNGINFKIGTPVCEDCWYVDHTRNIPEEMVKLGADLLITINQSYFYIGKQLIKYNMFSTIAKHNNVPVIMVNSVGCGDIVKNFVSYPGGSMFFNDNGKMISNQPLFQEHTLKFDFNSKFKLYDWNLYKYEEILQDLLYVQKEIFRVQGISKAQVHCSGGLDSAVVSYIVTKAMGTTNTILISNPSLCNGDETKSNAQYIADKLKCNLYWEPIEDMYQSIKTTDEKAFNDSVYEQKKTALSSMQAVGRTVLGLAASIRFNSAIVCTSNLTELCLGWYSLV